MPSPSSRSRFATTRPLGLSLSLSERNTIPDVGNMVPAADSALMNARPNVVSMPITSPVERISGPRAVSTPGKRLNGSTASFTETCPKLVGGFSKPSVRSSASVAPSMTRLATFANGTPVALATNGTVRLARGFASMTYTVEPATANCTLSRPITLRALAITRVYDSTASITHGSSVGGGIAQAESPECTPASSTCSMTPPMSTSPLASRIASTSISVASSRKRSISTGRSADKPPSLPSVPAAASSLIARCKCASS